MDDDDSGWSVVSEIEHSQPFCQSVIPSTLNVGFDQHS